MSTELLFQTHLVLGYVAWLLCFGVYILPRLRSMDRVEAQRAIATLHSFRFFGLVFILPGVVGPNLPAGFAAFDFARDHYWSFASDVVPRSGREIEPSHDRAWAWDGIDLGGNN